MHENTSAMAAPMNPKKGATSLFSPPASAMCKVIAEKAARAVAFFIEAYIFSTLIWEVTKVLAIGTSVRFKEGVLCMLFFAGKVFNFELRH
jgi:hypothetical protein